MQGGNHGQLAVANRDVSQTQNHTIDAQVLTIFAQAPREFATLLLDQVAEYEQLATALELKAGKDAPDKGWVKSLLDNAKDLLGKADRLQGVAQLAGLGLQISALARAAPDGWLLMAHVRDRHWCQWHANRTTTV